MVSRVLVAMDDSEMAEQALEYAFEAHPSAEVTVLHVVGTPSAMMGSAVALALEENIEDAAEELAAPVFERATEIADEHDATIETMVRLGAPAKDIINEADAFDTVIIGAHSGSLADRLFVGDVAQRVFRHAPVPVTVVR